MDDSEAHKEVRAKVNDFMREYMGHEPEQQRTDNLNAMNIVDAWFNPEPQLIKHLIIIQMIASMIVCALMIIVEGQKMNPMEGMFSISLFMFMAAFTAVLYNRF